MRQRGHEKHEGHAAQAREILGMVHKASGDMQHRLMAEAQVHATMAVYEALIMQHAGRGPSVAEMASDS